MYPLILSNAAIKKMKSEKKIMNFIKKYLEIREKIHNQVTNVLFFRFLKKVFFKISDTICLPGF